MGNSESFVVLAVLLAAAVSSVYWSAHGNSCCMWASERATTRTIMFHLAHADIPAFLDAHGRFPEDLAELRARPTGSDRPRVRDGWGWPMRYRALVGGEFRIVSYGADGRVGGQGEDADIRWPEDF